ncbi:Protein of unknown function [Propionibacterium freudenreichii]|nr:Protein of unknown function [Propionibacterium freudenreichii]
MAAQTAAANAETDELVS